MFGFVWICLLFMYRSCWSSKVRLSQPVSGSELYSENELYYLSIKLKIIFKNKQKMPTSQALTICIWMRIVHVVKCFNIVFFTIFVRSEVYIVCRTIKRKLELMFIYKNAHNEQINWQSWWYLMGFGFYGEMSQRSPNLWMMVSFVLDY